MKKSAFAAAASILLTGTLVAVAGEKVVNPVNTTVTSYEWTSGGDLGAVRAASNTIESIGCNTYTYSNSAYGYYNGYAYDNRVTTLCWARDVNGWYRTCYSYSPGVATVASSLSGDSRLEFGWYSSYCESVRVYNGSQYRPKSL
jgi:hypothetical protein